MRKILLLTLLTAASGAVIFAQNILPIGQWRSHLPYRVGQFVTQSADKIYYATDLSIVTLDKEDQASDFLAKVNGLSNTGISMIRYNRFSDVLVVVYKDAIIDLIKPEGTSVMRQIRNFANFSGEKRINDIFIENDSIIYLAATYGVSKINIKAEEFVFTTFTDVEVRNVQLYNGEVYAATEDGIYRVSPATSNIDDFNNWKLLGPDHGFPADYSSKAMVSFDGQLIVDVNDTLFVVNDGALAYWHTEAAENYGIYFLTAEGAHLLAGYRCSQPGCVFGKVLVFNPDGTFFPAPPGCVNIPTTAVEDEQGRIWFGELFRDFRVSYNPSGDVFCSLFSFESPYSENAWAMTVENNQFWLASGALNQQLGYRFLEDGFSSFIDGEWTIYNRQTRQEMRGMDGSSDPGFTSDDLRDILAIAVSPVSGKVYAGSYLEGLIEFDPALDKMMVFNQSNSILQGALQDESRTRISGLAFDDEDNLWISNHRAVNDKPIVRLAKDGTWKSFGANCGQIELFQVDVDQSNFKWFVTGASQGVMVFDEGEEDLDTDDRCRNFTTSNSNLPTNAINCLVVDLDGDVWVGTSEGIVIFECGSNAFDGSCRGTRPIVEVDGFGAYLLETENVKTIAIDGANRKWIGTENGLYLISADGSEQIARFTVDNSPLFDNIIQSIAVNQKTGEVFISTQKGVLSYQSDAIEGNRVHSAKIEVYPNPVYSDYDGPIAVRGLARDAVVKITDIHGRLVYETKALGGQAVWDGRDYNGRRAATGVYLIFSSSNPRFSGFGNPDAAVAKIVLVH
ncbi:MAG: hypothetical protein HUU01_00390 [Saprospiraceae bacterium]|nr:hypothetical protein [Saprospiraceae bacterium]